MPVTLIIKFDKIIPALGQKIGATFMAFHLLNYDYMFRTFKIKVPKVSAEQYPRQAIASRDILSLQLSPDPTGSEFAHSFKNTFS